MRDLFDKNFKRYIAVGIILIAVYFGFYYIDGLRGILLTSYGVFRPIVYGLVIAFIINLPMKFFTDKVFKKFLDYNKHKAPILILSLLASWIIFFAIVTIILTVLIPELTKAVRVVIENIPIFFDSLIKFLNQFKVSEQLSDTIQAKINEFDLNNLTRNLTEFMQKFLFAEGNIFNKTGNIINSLSQALMSIIIGFIFSIYVSLNKKDLQKSSTKLIFANFNKDVANQIIYIAKLTYDSFARFLETRLLSCLSIGLACFLGMGLLRLPSAGMISILVGAFDIIPYFGPMIATAIGMILIFIQSPTQSLIFLIFILIIQQIQEQILYPLVIGKRQGLPAIWIFVSVLLGGGLFGILGMIAFMPIATVIYTLVDDNINKKLKKKNITDEDINNISKKSLEQMRKEKNQDQ